VPAVPLLESRTVRHPAGLIGLVAAVLVLAALAAPGPALAHAALEAADPAQGSTIPETPELVTADFTDRLDPGLSSLTLAAPDGTILATGGVAPGDPEARQMVLRPPTLGDGVYTVGWTAVSADDGDVKTGSYEFTVATPTPRPTVPPSSPTATPTPIAPSSTPSATPSAAATATTTPAVASSPPSPEPSPSPEPGGGGSGTGAEPIVVAIVLAIVAAAAVGAIVAYRRRRGGGTA
jgi:methionine-rich copper-binding protein CopC